MQNKQTKVITQGAAMLALFLIFFSMAMYVPLIGFFAFLIAPIPIAWYSANFNRKEALTLGVLSLLASFIVGGLLGPILGIVFVATGIVMGDAIREKKSKVYLFLSTGITLLLSFALLFLILTNLIGINFIDEGLDLFQEAYTESIEYASAQLGEDVPTENVKQMFEYMEMSLPSAITLSVFLVSFIIISITTTVFSRLGLDIQRFSKFSGLRLPKAILWYYLIVLTINLFVQPEYGSNLAVIILNFSIVLWVLLTIQGVSFLFYTIEAFKYPNFLKVLIVLISIPMYSFVVLIGIIDLGFNIRDYIDGKSQGRS